MSFPFYQQLDSMDCGPTCLRMIAKYYGKSISLQSLRDKTQIGKEGVNMLGISEAAESIGFRSLGAKITAQQLIHETPLPAILHWKQNHFVVLYKIKGKTFHIADPAVGLRQYNQKELLEAWISDQQSGSSLGIALLLEPGKDFGQSSGEITDDNPVSEKLGFMSIRQYILPHKKLLFQLVLGLGVASLLQLILPFLTQSVVDTGVNTGNIHFVYIVLLAQLALFTGRMTIEFVRSWVLLHISTRINLSILTDFLIKLMKLPISFFDSKRTGDILQRMNDHQRIESFLTGSSLNVLFATINLLIFSLVLAFFNVAIFTVFIISAAMYSGWVILFLKKRKRLDYQRFDVAAKEQSNMIQLVQGMQEVKLYGVEKPVRWGWERLQARLFKLSMRGLSLNQYQQAGAFFINEGKNILITFLSAKAVIEHQMSLGTMLAVQYIIGQLNSPIEQMIGFIQSWQNARISIDRLNEIHEMEDEEPAHKQLLPQLPAGFLRQLSGGRRPEFERDIPVASPTTVFEEPVQALPAVVEDRSDISINGLHFTYSGAGNDPVLKDINLTIPVGKTTAIVGTSGSGKTTLLKLLLKFYTPQKGEIRLNNTSLESISHRAWRSHCGVVMQESFIFSDTIAKNIAMGEERIDKEKLDHAIRIANISDLIHSLPLGYNTKIGAEGNGISMGQRQRILIARAIYRNPAFIFFDEATNSLDANNESTILHNLEQFFHGKTVVVVAHRLSTVKKADQIIVLNKGRVTEKGTHHELISLQGEYFQLVKNQLELGD